MMTWTVPKPRRRWKERISIPPALCIALFLNFPLPVSASPSSDSDDNSTEMSADERSQRLEMLRSRNPGPATPSSSSSSRGNYSAPYQARPAVSIPPFGTSKPIKAEKTPAAPVATKPRKAPKPPLQPTAHKTEAPAKQSKPIAMAKAPKLKAAKSAKPSNTTNLKQGKPILDSSDTPPSTPASTSNSGSLPERQPSVKRQESALTDETIDSDFRPPAIRFDGNEYVVEGLKSTKTTKFLTFEEWGQSLNRIHRDVLDSHENDTGLAGESWLNMGAENPALTKEEDAPPPALASSIRIPIELKKRGPS